MPIWQQIRNNQLAIISLVVALTALGYNTWRNELTEHNRNVRQAGFEMLVHVAELQRITYLAHYDRDLNEGNPRKGWAEVLVLQDLAQLLPEPAPLKTDGLADAWGQNWEKLGRDPDSVAAIDSAIDELRSAILECLAELD
jgi:hypothetical protein